MGHRTLTFSLLWRALFLDQEAFEELKNDDNPFVEGLFLVTLLAVLAALLSLVGQTVAWASAPQPEAIQQIVWNALQRQPGWTSALADAEALAGFQRWWDTAWQVLPPLLGAPDPATAALNLLVWPVSAVASWLLYGLLAHLAARLVGGAGTLSQTLGVLALSFTPWLLRGLGLIPFVVIGGVLSTWQLLLRYRAVRTAHALPWPRALWATLFPFLVYLVFWATMTGLALLGLAAVAGRF